MKILMALAVLFLIGCDEAVENANIDTTLEKEQLPLPSIETGCSDVGVVGCEGWHYSITGYSEPTSCLDPDFADNVDLLGGVVSSSNGFSGEFVYDVDYENNLVTFNHSITGAFEAEFSFSVDHNLQELNVDIGCTTDFIYSLIPVSNPAQGSL